MNEIWVNRLTAGTKAWEDVPASRKNAIKGLLLERVKNEVITLEKYTEITGEE